MGRGAGAAGEPEGAQEGVRRHRGIPVATGERIHQRLEYREVFELQAADVIQPDISHIGGLLETKKLAAWADAYYVTIAPHNVGGQINTAAALHLAACTTNFRIQEYFNDFADPWVRDTAPGLPEVVDGYFELPKGPGLGVELDEEVIAANPKKDVHFNLFAEGWEKREARGRTDDRPLGQEGAGHGRRHGHRAGDRRRARPQRRRGGRPLRPHRARRDGGARSKSSAARPPPSRAT